MQETVVGYMRDNFLLWDSVEERTAPLAGVFAEVKGKMQSSPASYQFVQQEYFLRGHEGLGLTLLEHINHGHLNNNQAALRATSYRAVTTIESLLQDKNQFAVAAHNLGFYESSFVLNAGKSLLTLIGIPGNLIASSCLTVPAKSFVLRECTRMLGASVLCCILPGLPAIAGQLL